MASFHRETACLALFLLLPKYPNPFGCHGLCHSLNFIVVVLAAAANEQGEAFQEPCFPTLPGGSQARPLAKIPGTLCDLEGLPHPCSSLLLISVLTFFRVCDAWGGCWVLCSFPPWVVEQGCSPLQAMNKVGTEHPAHGCDQNNMFALLPEPLVTLIVLSLFNFVALFYFGI